VLRSRAEQVSCRAVPNFCRFAMSDNYNIARYADFSIYRSSEGLIFVYFAMVFDQRLEVNRVEACEVKPASRDDEVRSTSRDSAISRARLQHVEITLEG
jgi:hypothetical protein